MSKLKFKNHFSNSIYLFGSGPYAYVALNRVDARDDHPGRAAAFNFYDTKSADSKGFQFVVVTKRGNRYSDASGCLQDSHFLLCPDFFAVYF